MLYSPVAGVTPSSVSGPRWNTGRLAIGPGAPSSSATLVARLASGRPLTSHKRHRERRRVGEVEQGRALAAELEVVRVEGPGDHVAVDVVATRGRVAGAGGTGRRTSWNWVAPSPAVRRAPPMVLSPGEVMRATPPSAAAARRISVGEAADEAEAERQGRHGAAGPGQDGAAAPAGWVRG